jgi:hypothetical protein
LFRRRKSRSKEMSNAADSVNAVDLNYVDKFKKGKIGIKN